MTAYFLMEFVSDNNAEQFLEDAGISNRILEVITIHSDLSSLNAKGLVL